jgi:hypothetical protein
MRLAIDASHVIDNPAGHRFELPLDAGEAVVAYYRIEGNVVLFPSHRGAATLFGTRHRLRPCDRSARADSKERTARYRQLPNCGGYTRTSPRRIDVLLNQVAPEDLAPPQRVAETIAEDALSALTTCRFCDERRCVDCSMEVFGIPEPPQFDRHGVRLLFGQNTYNSKETANDHSYKPGSSSDR